MFIQVSILKEVINEKVETIKEQLEGNTQPSIAKYEAIRELGTISALVIGIHDKINDEKLKDEVWSLKEDADELFQKLMGF